MTKKDVYRLAADRIYRHCRILYFPNEVPGFIDMEQAIAIRNLVNSQLPAYIFECRNVFCNVAELLLRCDERERFFLAGGIKRPKSWEAEIQAVFKQCYEHLSNPEKEFSPFE